MDELESFQKYLEHQCGDAWVLYWMAYKWELAAMAQGGEA
jgi:hypothetical protein